MNYVIEYLAKSLKKAREDKKLSQRALSKRVGMTQAQISRIENAATDLKASNLVELARTLDLEVMLVPRKLVTTVTSLNRMTIPDANTATPPKPAYSLDDEGYDG